MTKRSEGFLRIHSNFFEIIREIYADCPPKKLGRYQVYIWKVIAYLCHSIMNDKVPNYSLPAYVNIDRAFISIPLPVHRIIKNSTKDKLKHFQNFMNKNWKLFFRIKAKKDYFLLQVSCALLTGLRLALRHQKGFVKIPFKDFDRIENIFDFICVFYKNSLCKKYDEIIFNKVAKEWAFIFNRYDKKNRYKLFLRLKESASKFGFRFFTMDDSNIIYLKDFKMKKKRREGYAHPYQRG